MPSGASARPAQCDDARQTSRSAMRPKPIGSARSAIHFGTPGAISSPARRSLWTSTIAPSVNIVAIMAPIAAGEHVRDGADAPLREELAGGEREQLAFARGDRRAQHAEPQRERGRVGARAGDRRHEELARRDLDERDQHDPAQREAGDAVLGLDGQRCASARDGPSPTCLWLCGRRRAPASPA